MREYTFIKNGEELNSAQAESLEEAEKFCQLTKKDYDSYVPSDKGTKRSKKEDAPKPAKAGRRAQQFFISQGGNLSGSMNKAQVIKEIDKLNDPALRIIVGHEISFVKKIHLKGL